MSKVYLAGRLIDNVYSNFDEMRMLIGPSGKVSMLLADTEFQDDATDIAILFDELSNDLDELKLNINSRAA